MFQNRHEPPAGALARGNTKKSDIETTRRDLHRAEKSAARELKAAAVRHDQRVARRERDAVDAGDAPPGRERV
jgi:hypothetical protein